MLRWSMLVGWYEFIRDPRSIRFTKRYSGLRFVAVRKRFSGRSNTNTSSGKSEKLSYFAAPETLLGGQPSCVLPDPHASSPRLLSVLEAGDVSTRHATTNLFEEGDDDELEGEIMGSGKGKWKGRRARDDDESDLV